MQLVYDVEDKPKFDKLMLGALQQLLAILAGTITLPLIVGHGMNQGAALFGAGVGTICYLCFTKFKSPVFLGSTFTYFAVIRLIFEHAPTSQSAYFALILGSFFIGLVYCLLGLVVKFAGTGWVNRLMPPVIIGPVVTTIGLSLAPNAIADLLNLRGGDGFSLNTYLCLICGFVTFFATIIVSVYGKKWIKLIPFIIGIGAGYLVALLFSLIGKKSGNSAFCIIDFSVFNTQKWHPEFAFVKAFCSGGQKLSHSEFWSLFSLTATSFIPLTFVTFAEHIADHKNLSFIINRDLLKSPGLSRTLLGDGFGSAIGAFFGGCPNTTYGESISCLALSRNASSITIFTSAILAITLSFVAPAMSFFKSIPAPVIAGACIALYGFISASGLQMLKNVDFTESKNIFIVSAVLISGVGGLALWFYGVVISPIVTGMIMGIITNLILSKKND